MFLNLIVLGFVLSLDNFRTAVILGPLCFPWRHALEIAVVFGFFDGVAPLVGILVGHDVGQEIGGEIADHVGAALLGLSPLVPAILFGAITALMTLVGLYLGRIVSRFIRIRLRWDVVVGVALIIEAFMLGLRVLPGD